MPGGAARRQDGRLQQLFGVVYQAENDLLGPLAEEVIMKAEPPFMLYFGFASSSSAALLRINSVEPLRCAICRFLNSVNRRVTVSREVPIISAISSCVKANLTRGSCLADSPSFELHSRSQSIRHAVRTVSHRDVTGSDRSLSRNALGSAIGLVRAHRTSSTRLETPILSKIRKR